MRTRTRWSPDTCGCVIDYEWDTDSPEDTRVHTPKVVQPCPVHTDAPIAAAIRRVTRRTPNGRAVTERAVSDPALVGALFDRVLEENQRKNRAVAALLEHDPTLTIDAVAWSFDPARRLRIEAPTLGRDARAHAPARLREAAGDLVDLV